MRTDDVAVGRTRYRADDGAAFARGGGAPVDWKGQFAAWRRMRGEADMIGPICCHHKTRVAVTGIQKDKARHRRRASASGLLLGFKGRLDFFAGSIDPIIEVVP